MANRIMLNETSYHGAGAIQEIAAEAKARAYKKAFVCSDPDLIKFGVTAKVTDVLDHAGLAYEIYSDIKANPTIENVQHGVQAFKDAGADYIVAIGGGSSMDTAKACNFLFTNGGSMSDYQGTGKATKLMLPLIAIPTTAGTGSETTGVAIDLSKVTREAEADEPTKAAPSSSNTSRSDPSSPTSPCSSGKMTAPGWDCSNSTTPD